MIVFVYCSGDTMQHVTVATVLAVVSVSATSYRPPAPVNVSTAPTLIGQIGMYTQARKYL